MKRDKIINLIREIESEPDLDKEGYIATHYINDSLESFIVANKKGVLNFILHLLKALNDFDFHLSKENHYSTIKLKKEDWFDKDSHFKFDWIQPIKEKKEDIYFENSQRLKKRNKFKEKFYILKIYFIFYSIRVFALIGFILTVKWLYKLMF